MSEPIARRSLVTEYRIKVTRCQSCGAVYFPPKYFCNNEGRESEMIELDHFYELGELYSGSVINEPTKRFSQLNRFVSAIVSLNSSKVRVPGRITDYRPAGDLDVKDLIGREVIPRFRRMYSDGADGLIYYSSHNFSFKDDYYPHQKYEAITPSSKDGKPGIVGYGVYVPKFRIKNDEPALGVVERGVPFADEDTTTFAVEAGKRALIHSAVKNRDVKKCFVGSESAPYAVKPSMSTVIQVLELGERFESGFFSGGIDSQFACKAATDLVIDAAALVSYPVFKGGYVMVIGADNAQAAPKDRLDYTVGAGGAALIIGKDDVIATLDHYLPYTSDTPDFYRREGERYPKHGGRFTGQPAYFKHVVTAMRGILKETGLAPSDIDYVACHSPNAKFPVQAAEDLGFEKRQYEPSLVVKRIGNLYSGSSLAALGAVLDIAKPGQRILLTSYGSGAGSESYIFTVTNLIEEKRRRLVPVKEQIEHPKREYVDYYTYREWKDMA
ncbi:MAG: hydroxymethylglutaryl-CoA synthase [Thaumarchaeota archaeon]|nr:hydroxymethylglutaryl-CoA synthase [Nitrososphaerota archaeon]MCL5318835.1 hydroxymethylglutaryl-CoA synthase [Nitrososphaerota archaeon]